MRSDMRFFSRLRRLLGAEDALPIDPDLAPDDPGEPSLLHKPAATVFHRRDAGVLIAIGVGGIVGTVGRYALELAFPTHPGTFPLATFLVNTSGAFLLGLLLTVILERFPHTKYLRPLTCVGILGSWTTMSTFVTEANIIAFNMDRPMTATGYIAATFAAGLVATVIGIALGRLRRGERL